MHTYNNYKIPLGFLPKNLIPLKFLFTYTVHVIFQVSLITMFENMQVLFNSDIFPTCCHHHC